MSKRAGLAEIMGARGAELGKKGIALADLPELLGDAHPDLPKDAVGRHRLVRALKARFGPNFRALPGVADVLKEFDGVVSVEGQIARIKQLKYSPKGGSRG